MTGRTHHIGGITCCLAGYLYLRDNGNLLTEISPLLQLTVMYPFALFGSTLPDLDHGKDSIPSKDIVSVVINKTLHLSTKHRKTVEKLTGKTPDMGVLSLFDAKHRSWQTHSDLFFVLILALYNYLIMYSMYSVNILLGRTILSGLLLGVLSHFILDILTPEGIHMLLFKILNKIFKKRLPEKISLVPKKEFFATDGPWESLVKGILWCSNLVMLLMVIYPMLPYKLIFNI